MARFHRSLLALSNCEIDVEAMSTQSEILLYQCVDTESRSHAVKIDLQGPIVDRQQAHEAIEAANELIAAHAGGLRRLIIDLQRVVSPNSMTVSMLLEMLRIAREQDLEPVLHGPNRDLIQLLRMLRLDGRYTMSLSSKELSRAMAA